MALKTVLESLDGIDDAIQSLYIEKDGKFLLDVEGVDDHPDVVNLKTAYEREKGKRQEALTERDALKAKIEGIPDDFDPEIWKKAKDGKADEAALVNLRKELEAERDEWKSKAEEGDAKLNRFAVERDLSDALVAAGINEPSFTKAARVMLADKVKAGEDGKAIVDTDMGPMAVSDYVAKWATGEGKPFVTPAKGGDRGGSEKSGTGTGKLKRSEMNQVQKAEFIGEHGADEYNKLPE